MDAVAELVEPILNGNSAVKNISLERRSARRLMLGELFMFRATANDARSGLSKEVMEDALTAKALFDTHGEEDLQVRCCEVILGWCGQSDECDIEYLRELISGCVQTLEVVLPRLSSSFWKGNALALLGDAILLPASGLQHQASEAVEYYEKALETSVGENSEISIQILFNMSIAYQKISHAEDPAIIEKRILTSEVLLSRATKSTNPLIVAKAWLDKGLAYSCRSDGDPSSNALVAKEAFDEAIPRFAKLDVQIWAIACLESLKIALRLDYPSEELEREIAAHESRIAEVMESMLETGDEELLVQTLGLYQKLAAHPASSLQEDQDSNDFVLEDILGHLPKQDSPGLWRRLSYERIARIHAGGTKQAYETALSEYLHILEDDDLPTSSDHLFDLHVRIACVYLDLEDYARSSEYFALALDSVEEKAAGEYRGWGSMAYSFPGIESLVQRAPFAMIASGDVVRGLKYWEYINCRGLAESLEDLACVDSMVNRESLFNSYNDALRANSVAARGDANWIGSAMTNGARFRTRVDSLKAAAPRGTRRTFYEDLDFHLKRIDRWVLLPVMDEHSGFLILIPPEGEVTDIRASSLLDFGFKDELRALGSEGPMCWHTALNENDDEKKFDQALSSVGDWIWNKYLSWTCDQIRERADSKEKHLCIVAKGMMSYFPFSTARCQDTLRGIPDDLTISYAPSLFGVFSLIYRLRLYESDSHTIPRERAMRLCYVVSDQPADSDGHLECLEFERSAVESQALGQSGVGYLSPGEAEPFKYHDQSDNLETIVESLPAYNHWHFAGHGFHQWSNSGESHIRIGPGILSKRNVPLLRARSFLRLTVLSGCETGMSNALSPKLEPDGFAYEFLKLGSAGVIGYLWKVSDVAAALISAKFYELHASGTRPPEALRQTQVWMRDLSYDELLIFLQQIPDTEKVQEAIAKLKPKPEERLFKSPAYWSGAVFIGA